MKEDRSQCAFLPALDSDGLDPANAATIVVADSTPDPTKPAGETNQSIRDAFNKNTPNYLSANTRIPAEFLPTTPDAEPMRLQMQKRTTAEYYGAIGIDSDGAGLPIKLAIPTLDRFIKHYFRRFEEHCAFPHPEVPGLLIENERKRTAKYFNKGDLGIGREMNCIYRACTKELACYVKNFAGIKRGKSLFGNKAQAERALRADRPFATVAMVERGEMVDLGLPNSVFFVVYGANGRIVEDRAQLDNKGFNTSIPGNCLQCHGINSDATDVREVTNAMFLPFDLDAFEFFGKKKADRLSRAAQEPAFRAFNRMVLGSALGRSAAARELIQGWYAGDLSDRTNNKFRKFVPGGWQNAVDPQGQPDIRARLHQLQLYSKFVAVACRSCHISWVDPNSLQPGVLSFSTFQDFEMRRALSKLITCSSAPALPEQGHEMPAAEQTVKVLWRSQGRQHFFAQVPGEFGDCRP